MSNLIEILENKGIALPENVLELLTNCKSYRLFNTVDELADASTGGKDSNYFEVTYDLPDNKKYTEAIVHRVSNGISANYTEAYMRRRDPDTMYIADDLPTDKPLFKDKFKYDFSSLEDESLTWLKEQDLAVFFYFAGYKDIGSGGMAIAPMNAGFFAMGLAMLQKIMPIDTLTKDFAVESVIYVAPTFRHTHFEGKQIVVHKRSSNLHEMYAYNLYPGPSAKKGLYGVLLNKGEKEGWATAHCSTVQTISPYDNTTTFMHEGASGGGKSEMMQHIVRETDGRVLLGENLISKEKRFIRLPIFCRFQPVTDDMAMCHTSLQKSNGKLTVLDAENSWFVRVDGVNDYGDDPFLEKATIKPQKQLLFFNIKTNPGGTALIWDHIEDAPGKRCPNPRVVLPREIVPNIVEDSATIDIRSFGVRTPPSTNEDPNYGIIGLFHILPPALAWLWRLVSPRGYGNPSIIDTGGMQSEGVGSYWPFATGKRSTHANLLLEQIIQTPRVRYTLVPNQHIGAWKMGFKPQLLMREYLTRRGNAKLRSDQFQEARSSLLGYELNYITIEGSKIPSRFLKVYRQPEMGTDGYDKGAKMLSDFFKRELTQYLTPDLMPLGRRVIEACLADASIEDYNKIMPINYKYSFLTKDDYK